MFNATSGACNKSPFSLTPLLVFSFLYLSHHFYDAFAQCGFHFTPSLCLSSDHAEKTLGNSWGMLLATLCGHCLLNFCPQSLYLFDSAITKSVISQHTELHCWTEIPPAAVWPHFNLLSRCHQTWVTFFFVEYLSVQISRWVGFAACSVTDFKVFSNDCINFIPLANYLAVRAS